MVLPNLIPDPLLMDLNSACKRGDQHLAAEAARRLSSFHGRIGYERVISDVWSCMMEAMDWDVKASYMLCIQYLLYGGGAYLSKGQWGKFFASTGSVTSRQAADITRLSRLQTPSESATYHTELLLVFSKLDKDDSYHKVLAVDILLDSYPHLGYCKDAVDCFLLDMANADAHVLCRIMTTYLNVNLSSFRSCTNPALWKGSDVDAHDENVPWYKCFSTFCSPILCQYAELSRGMIAVLDSAWPIFSWLSPLVYSMLYGRSFEELFPDPGEGPFSENLRALYCVLLFSSGFLADDLQREGKCMRYLIPSVVHTRKEFMDYAWEATALSTSDPSLTHMILVSLVDSILSVPCAVVADIKKLTDRDALQFTSSSVERYTYQREVDAWITVFWIASRMSGATTMRRPDDSALHFAQRLIGTFSEWMCLHEFSFYRHPQITRACSSYFRVSSIDEFVDIRGTCFEELVSVLRGVASRPKCLQALVWSHKVLSQAAPSLMTRFACLGGQNGPLLVGASVDISNLSCAVRYHVTNMSAADTLACEFAMQYRCSLRSGDRTALGGSGQNSKSRYLQLLSLEAGRTSSWEWSVPIDASYPCVLELTLVLKRPYRLSYTPLRVPLSVWFEPLLGDPSTVTFPHSFNVSFVGPLEGFAAHGDWRAAILRRSDDVVALSSSMLYSSSLVLLRRMLSYLAVIGNLRHD